MEVSLISTRYSVRRLTAEDVPAVFSLCSKNEQYYRYCPPFVTERSIMEDMKALPPKKGPEDKYYVGFFDGGELVAVLDLIVSFPNDRTAFIGFFMLEKRLSGGGVGSSMIEGLKAYLKKLGFTHIRLGWAKGNPQAEHFWKKNGFTETGVSYKAEGYTVIVAECAL